MSTKVNDEKGTFKVTAVAFIFVPAAIGAFLLGYDIGAMSYAIMQLASAKLSGVSFWHSVSESAVLEGSIVSMTSAGAVFGSIVVLLVVDRVSRLSEFIAAAFLYLVGAIILTAPAYLPLPRGIAIATILIGRIIYGAGMGVSSHVSPTYVGEMVPSSIRGAVVSLKEVSIVAGILMGNVIGYAFSNSERGWAYCFLCTVPLSVLMAVISFRVPESARWLMYRFKGRRDEDALKSLLVVYTHDRAHELYEEMKKVSVSALNATDNKVSNDAPSETEETGPEQEKEEVTKPLFHRSRRPALIAGLGLVILQQLSGQPSVLSYSKPILNSAGLSNFAPVLVSLSKLVATMVAVFTADTSGRRKLLLAGSWLMLGALIVLTFSLRGASGSVSSDDDDTGEDGDDVDNKDEDDDDEDDEMLGTRQIATIWAMFVYISGFQVGFGPMTWLLIAEVFPLSVRGHAIAVALQLNFSLNGLVQLAVAVLKKAMGLSATVGIFAVVTAYSIYFIWKYIPELRGLSLEEIEQKFQVMDSDKQSGTAQNAREKDAETEASEDALENTDSDA